MHPFLNASRYRQGQVQGGIGASRPVYPPNDFHNELEGYHDLCLNELTVLQLCGIRVEPSHRTLADFLKELEAQEWITEHAGKYLWYSDLSDIYIPASLAALKATISLVQMIYTFENSKSQGSSDLYSICRRMLYLRRMGDVVREVEQAPQENVLAY